MKTCNMFINNHVYSHICILYIFYYRFVLLRPWYETKINRKNKNKNWLGVKRVTGRYAESHITFTFLTEWGCLASITHTAYSIFICFSSILFYHNEYLPIHLLSHPVQDKGFNMNTFQYIQSKAIKKKKNVIEQFAIKHTYKYFIVVLSHLHSINNCVFYHSRKSDRRHSWWFLLHSYYELWFSKHYLIQLHSLNQKYKRNCKI